MNNQEILDNAPEVQRFAKYEYKAPDITKDGHTMFNKDIVKDLNRKSFLESELIKLKKLNAELNNIVSVLTIADETGYVDGEGFVIGFNQITDDAREFLAAHNLEQQIKGVMDYEDCLSSFAYDAEEYCDKLREQAKR